MNKSWLVLCGFSALCLAAEQGFPRISETQVRTVTAVPRTLAQESDVLKQAAWVAEIVPHLSANDTWKSALYVRSDTQVSATFIIEFYTPEGALANVDFIDNDGNRFVASSYQRVLTGFELITLELDSAQGANSVQAFVFAQEGVGFSVEPIYHRYDGPYKLASVGTKGAYPGKGFILNVEERADLITGQFNYRAFALTNTTESWCDCQVELYDHGAFGANLEGFLSITDVIPVPPRGKRIYYISDLFDIDLLPQGIGYVIVYCNRTATMMALTFEENSPAAGSVPVDTLAQ